MLTHAILIIHATASGCKVKVLPLGDTSMKGAECHGVAKARQVGCVEKSKDAGKQIYRGGLGELN